MKPKEKALELIEKLLLFQPLIPDYDRKGQAKQCAMIAVNEIINDNPNIYDSDRLNHKYWKEVIKEVELL